MQRAEIHSLLQAPHRVFLVGVGGSGMSALAKLLVARGISVLGSDQHASAVLEELHALGVEIFLGHAAEHVPGDCDLLVYSEAIPTENAERVFARERGIPECSYFAALGGVLLEQELIAVTGTHGKTTTTGMLTCVMLELNLDPTVVVGSELPFLPQGNFRAGKSAWAVVEGCEYRQNFLHLQPKIMLVVTLDYDHPDTYPDRASYIAAFQTLAESLPADGLLVLPEGCELDVSKMRAKVVRFAQDLPENVSLAVPGAHNRANASVVWKLAQTLGWDLKKVATGLGKYTGAKRRLEILGEKSGAVWLTDYAHHPVEIAATLQALREKYPNEKILAVFQPHQYSRTYALLSEFATCFGSVDEVLISEIYAARDTAEDRARVSGEDLTTKIAEQGVKVHYSGDVAQTAEKLRSTDAEVVVLLGAGDIPRVYDLV